MLTILPRKGHSMKIGIISDTHRYTSESCDIPDWIKKAFDGVDLIVHAGDIEHSKYITNLEYIAPVYAVRGNCDPYNSDNPVSRSINIGCGLLTVAHRPRDARNALDLRSRVLVYGHTHIADISEEDDLLVINPGSAYEPRSGMPPSVAVLNTDGDKLSAKLIFR